LHVASFGNFHFLRTPFLCYALKALQLRAMKPERPIYQG
jgi:hypothetical protein